MKCRAARFARGDRKFTAKNVATPLQYASAADTPPTTLNRLKISSLKTCEIQKTCRQDGQRKLLVALITKIYIKKRP